MHARQGALAVGLPSNPAPRPHPDFSDLQTFRSFELLLHLGATLCAHLHLGQDGRALELLLVSCQKYRLALWGKHLNKRNTAIINKCFRVNLLLKVLVTICNRSFNSSNLNLLSACPYWIKFLFKVAVQTFVSDIMFSAVLTSCKTSHVS